LRSTPLSDNSVLCVSARLAHGGEPQVRGRPCWARCRYAYCVCIMCVECVGNFLCHVCACLACASSDTRVLLCRWCVVVCCSTLASGAGDLTGHVAGTLIVCVSCVWSVWATLYAMFVFALRAPCLKLVCVCAGAGATGAVKPSQVVWATQLGALWVRCLCVYRMRAGCGHVMVHWVCLPCVRLV
jgi:hypothetical protein